MFQNVCVCEIKMQVSAQQRSRGVKAGRRNQNCILTRILGHAKCCVSKTTATFGSPTFCIITSAIL